MTAALELSVDGEPTRATRRLTSALANLGFWLLATIAVQSSVFAIVLMGFVYGAMQRQALGASNQPPGTWRTVWRRTRLGIAAVMTTASVTVLPGLLWTFAWHAGWDNSFNKGYEQAAVAPLVGLLGVAVFVLTMPYTQIAQARHAVSGDWRTFYQLGLNLRIWSAAPLRAALLALTYGLASLAVSAILVAPIVFSHGADYPSLSDADVRNRLALWNFASGAVFVMLLFGVKRLAAVTYVRALLRAVQRGRVDRRELHPVEVEVAAAVTSSRPPRRATLPLAAYPLVAILWMGVVGPLFVSQFLNYRGPAGWLNQPLIQIPVL